MWKPGCLVAEVCRQDVAKSPHFGEKSLPNFGCNMEATVSTRPLQSLCGVQPLRVFVVSGQYKHVKDLDTPAALVNPGFTPKQTNLGVKPIKLSGSFFHH